MLYCRPYPGKSPYVDFLTLGVMGPLFPHGHRTLFLFTRRAGRTILFGLAPVLNGPGGKMGGAWVRGGGRRERVE